MKRGIVWGCLCGIMFFSGCKNIEEYTTQEDSHVEKEAYFLNQIEKKESRFISLSAKEFKQFTDTISSTDKKHIILDVRTSEEFQMGHIKNAHNIDFYSPDFVTKISQLDKNKTYFIYCHSGNRSGQTFSLMKKLGFTTVYNLQYGINDWKQNNFPLVQ